MRLIMFLAMALSAPAASQVGSLPRLVEVGDGTIGAHSLQPYTNAWMFSFIKDGKKKDLGIWSDALHIRDVEGKHLLERVQGMTYSNGLSSLTINRFEPGTLAPVYSETHGPDGKLIKRNFFGRHVQTRLTDRPGANEKVSETDLPTPVFDFNGGMYGLLLAAQPLRVGYSASMPAVGEFTDDYVKIPFRVVRRETINAGFKGRTNAWVVEVSGDSPMTFWISDRPPYILRLVLPMNGGEALFEMIH